MSEQKHQLEREPLPQGACQEIEAQALKAVTGGAIEKPTPVGPKTYLYNSGVGVGNRRPGMVTLHTNDISIPDHTLVMGVQPPGTRWQHVPVPQPDGTIQHTYREIRPR